MKALRTLQILIFAAVAMALLLALIPAAGHDQLWFLLMAQRWLHGAELYGPEIFDSNTPAIVWLSAFPVGLAEQLRIPIPFVAKLCVVLLEAFIFCFAAHILRGLQPALTTARRLFLALAFVLLFAVAPARDLGQRDQLASLLCLPYLLCSARPKHLPKRLRILSALLAAAAFCLKPQLALIGLSVELAVLFRRDASWHESPRSSSPKNRVLTFLTRSEPWVFLSSAAAFLLAIHRYAPLFLSSALPIALSTYWAIGHLSIPQLASEAPQLLVLAAAACTLRSIRMASDSPLNGAAGTLLCAGLAATLAYFVQGTGWYYQQLPAIAFFGCSLALRLVDVTPGNAIAAPVWSPAAAAALSLLTLILTFHFSGFPFTLHPFTEDRAYAISTPDPSFFTGLAPGTPIATLTTSVDDAMMPVFRYHLVWAQRTNNLWTLPALLRASQPDSPAARRLGVQRLAQLSAEQRLWMVRDLTRWHPALVLVARCQAPEVHCQELEDRHDDLLTFFEADPAFARLWTHYRFVRSSGPYDAYSRSD